MPDPGNPHQSYRQANEPASDHADGEAFVRAAVIASDNRIERAALARVDDDESRLTEGDRDELDRIETARRVLAERLYEELV